MNSQPTVYIFDLDSTLYGPGDFIDTEDDEVYYSSFHRKDLLNKLLGSIKCPKYIITNANQRHANDVLRRLGIKFHFSDIISIDDVRNEKPHQEPFQLAYRRFNLQPHDNIVFFEDNVHNLLTAKTNAWTTVLIDPEHDSMRGGNRHRHVDLTFNTVEQALIYFITKSRGSQSASSHVHQGGAHPKRQRARRRTAKRRVIEKPPQNSSTVA
jgi:predicted HAD superfamily phosphohydrolase YqeG